MGSELSNKASVSETVKQCFQIVWLPCAELPVLCTQVPTSISECINSSDTDPEEEMKDTWIVWRNFVSSSILQLHFSLCVIASI